MSDAGRKDALPTITDRMGLDRTRDSALWNSRAIGELHAAELHSHSIPMPVFGSLTTNGLRPNSWVLSPRKKLGRACIGRLELDPVVDVGITSSDFSKGLERPRPFT
jgi:hypothetical protein